MLFSILDLPLMQKVSPSERLQPGGQKNLGPKMFLTHVPAETYH